MKKTFTHQFTTLFGALLASFALTAWCFTEATQAKLTPVTDVILDQQEKDTTAPQLAITTPLHDSEHNEVPQISGIAIDPDSVNPPVPASGLDKVEVSLYCDGAYWNGSDWVRDRVALAAQLSGNTWTLQTSLPDGEKQRRDNWYTILARAYDKAGNQIDVGRGFKVRPLKMLFVQDANYEYWGVDFSSDKPSSAQTSSAQAPVSPDKLKSIIQGTEFHLGPDFSLPKAWVFGAVSDGATKLILSVRGRSPGKVTFQKETTNATKDDKLTDINSAGNGENLTHQLFLDGFYYWFALYTVPSQTNPLTIPVSSPDAYSTLSKVKFSVSYTPTYGSRKSPPVEWSETGGVSLSPTPVLLVHGLWSSSKIWESRIGVMNSLGAAITGNELFLGFDVYTANYEATHADPLWVNQSIIFKSPYNSGDSIDKILKEYRNERRTACTRVDVIGHSMGGIVSRFFAQWKSYSSPRNFGKGYIRRLITIGTPHCGSPLATLGASLIGSSLSEWFAEHIQKAPIHLGAVKDLRIGSPALFGGRELPDGPVLPGITETKIPSFAIVGNIPINETPNAQSIKNAESLYVFSQFYSPIPGLDVSTPFDFSRTLLYDSDDTSQPQDLVVRGSSQRGGIAEGYYQVFTSARHSRNVGLDNLPSETDSPEIGQKIKQLMMSEESAFALSGFPAVSKVCSPVFHQSISGRPSERSSAESLVTNFQAQAITPLSILFPAEGAVFHPGDQISITVEPPNGKQLETMLVGVSVNGKSQNMALIQNGLTASFTISSIETGDGKVRVLARDTQGNTYIAERGIVVKPYAPVPLVSVAPESVTFWGSDETRQIEVKGGVFDIATMEFVKVDISAASNGTFYVSDNPQVVTVSQDGLLRPIGNGKAVVKVTNGERKVTITVNVDLAGPRVYGVSTSSFSLTSTGTSAASLEFSSGATNVPITIEGEGFRQVSQIEILRNGISDPAIKITSFSVESETVIRAEISIATGAAPGNRVISITTDNPRTVSSFTGGSVITVAPPEASPIPTISRLSPSSAVTGGQGFRVTVSGANFADGTIVLWNGVQRYTEFISATELRAYISAADITSAGTSQIRVVSPAGKESATASFTVQQASNPVPVLSSLTPSSVNAGSGTFTLTVRGSSFVNGAVIQWNGVSKVTTSASASELSASIPASDLTTAGTAQVKVVNPPPGGGTSGALAFTIAVPPNPVPILSSLTPNSANAGSSAIALTVRGSSFVNGAIVQWNGGSRPATFISATELRASIPASDLTSAGNSQVRVFNPSPGGGTSSALTFTISAPANPVPVLSFLTPNSAMAGSGAITLTVRGSSFANGAVIQWNGVSKVTTFISSTEVRGSILASDLAAARSVQVKVFNPAPGGGTSGTLTFTISAPSNPVPVLSSLTPSSANAGSGAFTLTVRGSSFVSGAVVQWNGVSKATTFVSATELQASIPTSDLANPGSAQVKVFNPAPGGGTSVGLMFTINSIPAQDMEREPNESPEQATPVGLGRVMTGKAAFSDSFIYEITFSDGQRERIPDFFKFELAQSAHLELSLKFNAGADLDLFLYSFDGSNWRYYGSSAGVTTSETVITNEPLPPGRYFILVGCYSGSSTYSLSVLPYAKTNLLVNGSFENGPAGLGVTSVPGWTVSRGNVDVIPNSAAVLWAWHQAADGSKSLELTGNPGVGAIRQTFSTEAGRKYLLTGWISHHFAVSTAGAKVSVNGEALEPIRYSVSNTQADMKWARFVRGFVARSASTTIELGDEDISNWIWGGAVLDGLSIETVSVTYQNNFQQNAGLSGLGNTSSAVVAERSILLNRKNPPRPEVRSLSVKERKLVNN